MFFAAGAAVLFATRDNVVRALHAHAMPETAAAATLVAGTLLIAAFTRLPHLEGGRLAYDPQGMSLFLTTPLLAFTLWPAARPRLHRILWLTVAATALPGFLYQNTGYVQFGYRFSLDWTPHLFALLALGGRPMRRGFWAVGLAGVAVNTWGALAFRGGVG